MKKILLTCLSIFVFAFFAPTILADDNYSIQIIPIAGAENPAPKSNSQNDTDIFVINYTDTYPVNLQIMVTPGPAPVDIPTKNAAWVSRNNFVNPTPIRLTMAGKEILNQAVPHRCIVSVYSATDVRVFNKG